MPAGHRPAPPTDTIRVALSGTMMTLPWTIVFYLAVTTDGTKTAADLKTVIDAVVLDFFNDFKANLSASVTVSSVHAVWITGVGTALEYQGSYNDVCTGGTAVDNTASCVVVNWTINAYYRGGHPRSYIPGVIQTGVVNGSALTPTYQTALATSANTWIGHVNAHTGTHILTVTLGTVSYATGNVWRSPPIFRAYTSASCRGIMGTQRRRLGGR